VTAAYQHRVAPPPHWCATSHTASRNTEPQLCCPSQRHHRHTFKPSLPQQHLSDRKVLFRCLYVNLVNILICHCHNSASTCLLTARTTNPWLFVLFTSLRGNTYREGKQHHAELLILLSPVFPLCLLHIPAATQPCKETPPWRLGTVAPQHNTTRVAHPTSLICLCRRHK
jgi:hypothetical protein